MINIKERKINCPYCKESIYIPQIESLTGKYHEERLRKLLNFYRKERTELKEEIRRLREENETLKIPAGKKECLIL